MKIEELVDALSAEADQVEVAPQSAATVRRRASFQRMRVASLVTAVALVVTTAAVAGGRGDDPSATVAAGEVKTARIRIVTRTLPPEADSRVKQSPFVRTVVGDFDFTNRKSAYTEHFSMTDAMTGQKHQQSTRVLQSGTEQWTELSASEAERLGVAAQWRHDPVSNPELAAPFDPFNAMDTFGGRSDQVKIDGTEILDGVETTRYQVLSDSSTVATPRSSGSFSSTSSETIWVDSQGRLRRMVKVDSVEFSGTDFGDYGSTTETTIDVIAFGVDLSDWAEPQASDVIDEDDYQALMREFAEKKDREDCKGTYTEEAQPDGTKQYSCQTPVHPEMTTTSVVNRS